MSHLESRTARLLPFPSATTSSPLAIFHNVCTQTYSGRGRWSFVMPLGIDTCNYMTQNDSVRWHLGVAVEVFHLRRMAVGSSSAPLMQRAHSSIRRSALPSAHCSHQEVKVEFKCHANNNHTCSRICLRVPSELTSRSPANSNFCRRVKNVNTRIFENRNRRVSTWKNYAHRKHWHISD